MPLTPEEALALTDENRRQADDLCRAIDAWLSLNLTLTDTTTRVPVEPPYPPRKVRGEVARRYREAGWLTAGFEPSFKGNGRPLDFVLWAPLGKRRPQVP